MSIKLLLCLVLVNALIHQSTAKVSYDAAIEKLENFLQSRTTSDSPADNIRVVQKFNMENEYITRENADIFGNRAAMLLFHLFGSLSLDKPSLCLSYEALDAMNTILGEKACRPNLVGGGRIERTAHEVCKKFARECIQDWSEYYRLKGRTDFERFFSVFLEDANSKRQLDLEAKIKQVEKNLNGPETGLLLVMAIYNQMSSVERLMSIQDVENNLEKTFEERVVKPCRQLDNKLVRSLELAIKMFKPEELPIHQDAMILYDQVNLKHVCQTLMAKKAEYIERTRRALYDQL